MKKKDLFGVAQETEVIDVCQELIRLKSVNPPGEELFAAQHVASILERAGLEVELMKNGNACGIIPAVFEPFEPIHQNLSRLSGTDISDDAAHGLLPIENSKS